LEQKFCLLRVLARSIATLLKAVRCMPTALASFSKKMLVVISIQAALQGAKHFALWPLSQAAQSCFGNDFWPDHVPVPQAWLEFEVENVEKATANLESLGHRMLVKNKRESWGQTVSRFLSPEGLLVGITLTPALREKK
jgi:hypothetical protein